MTRASTLLAVSVIVLASCGSTTSNAQAGQSVGSAAPSPSAANTAPSPLPDVQVVDVSTGQPVRLNGLIPSDKPTLVWFWAPH